MALARSYTGSQNSHRDATSPLLSPTFISSLPLPKALKENRSFANLAKLLGIADSEDRNPTDGVDSDEYDGQVEEDTSEDVDEDSLMWDAQTALIAHQPAIAIKYYSIAALPPYRSAAACLALGNLLARGSSLMQVESASSPTSHLSRDSRSSDQSDKTITNGKSTAARIRDIFFSSSPTTSPPESAPAIPIRPVAVGWGIPRVGNRAVRDVEGMNLASGWFVLGAGWIVDLEQAHDAKVHDDPSGTSADQAGSESDSDRDGKLVLPSKTNGRAARFTIAETDLRRDAEQHSSPDLSHSSSDKTESTVLKTPYTEDGPVRPGAVSPKSERSEYEQLKLMYDLLSPLVALYRHGQIQEHDPVSLPPVTAAQLPTCLQPQGDLQKRRNAWHLGSVVVDAAMQLCLLDDESVDQSKGKGKAKGKNKAMDKLTKRRVGVAVMANYILGMTRSNPEVYFRQIVTLGQCGLDMSDELVEQAAARLDLIARRTPSTASPISQQSEYPFPTMSGAARAKTSGNGKGKSHSRISSIASAKSNMSTISHRILPSMKSTASLASMAADLKGKPVYHHGPPVPPLPTNQSLAMDSLRRLRSSSTQPGETTYGAWWPSLSGWSLRSSVTTEQSGPTLATDTASSLQPADESTPLARPTRRTSPPPLPESFTSIQPTADLKHKPSASLTTAKSPHMPAQAPCIRTIASSPNFAIPAAGSGSGSGSRPSPSGQSTPRRRLPFEPSDADSINTIDPELAAAELRSALTKQVVCGVCSAKGVNFPNCRKCGLTFCSRVCRVDEKKAGDGKRHVCGAWESRKFLTVPTAATRSRRKSVARPSPLTIKA